MSKPVSNPPTSGLSMSSAVLCRVVVIVAGVSVEFAWSISAATAAAVGAAALVPKKFGELSASLTLSLPKKVVFPPSGAVKFGFCRLTAVCETPVVVNRIGVAPPREENDSTNGGFTPFQGVL